MENTWILYALGGLVALGMLDFLKKAVVQKGGDKDVFLYSTYVIWVILFLINGFIRGDWIISIELLFGATVIGVCTAIIPINLLIVFKHLDTAFALTFIKVIASIIVLIIGVFVLGDSINALNILGFFLGITAIILLSGFSIHKKYSLNKEGVIAMLLSLVGTVVAHSYFKYILGSVDIHTFLALQFSISFFILSVFMCIKGKFSNFSSEASYLVLPYVLGSGLLAFVQWVFFMPNIYEFGPLSLGYKILSYSIVVTIILSTIFYKEQITGKRIIAFILTLASLALFIV